MSLSSMANVARLRAMGRSAERKSDESTPQPATPPPPPPTSQSTGKVQKAAETAQGQVAQTDKVTAALDLMMAYVPTEILTLYVAVLAALQQDGYADDLGKKVFYGFLVATPVVMWLIFAAKMRAFDAKARLLTLHSLPLWEMFASSVAFTAWAVALPESPFTDQIGPGLAGVLVLATASVLGLLAPIFAPVDASA